MFDDDLILMDGTVALTAATDTVATSTTRLDTTGAAVIDLLETPAEGLTACMHLTNAVAADDASYIEAKLEASDTEDMTSATDIENLGRFGVANAATGRIVGSETPCWAYLRFATKKRYIRVNIDSISIDDTSMGNCKVYLTPYPFKNL